LRAKRGSAGLARRFAEIHPGIPGLSPAFPGFLGIVIPAFPGFYARPIRAFPGFSGTSGRFRWLAHDGRGTAT